MAIVFISHSYRDKNVVDKLYDTIQIGCNMKAEELKCSSVEDAGIETGEDFIIWIDENIKKADLVILLLSSNYYASKFAIAEMGASWALNKKVFPLIIEGENRDPGIVFMRHQSSKLDSTGLDNLRDAIVAVQDNPNSRTARWNIKSREFLENRDNLLEQLEKPDSVSRKAYEEKIEEVEEALELYKESNNKIDKLESIIEELKSIKGNAVVNEVLRKHDTAYERYIENLETLKEELNRFGAAEARALYAAYTRSGWIPSRDSWEYHGKEIEKGINSDWIFERDDDHEANLKHPRYVNVKKLLDSLASIIIELDDSIIEDMQKENGYIVDIDNMEFWETELLEYSMPE